MLGRQHRIEILRLFYDCTYELSKIQSIALTFTQYFLLKGCTLKYIYCVKLDLKLPSVPVSIPQQHTQHCIAWLGGKK